MKNLFKVVAKKNSIPCYLKIVLMTSTKKTCRKAKHLWSRNKSNSRSVHKSFHKAHTGNLIEINVTAPDPIIGVMYNCFSGFF